MANLLDEVTGPVNENGRDVRVIDRQIPVKVGFGSVVFEIALWIFIPIVVFLYVHFFGAMLPEPMLVLAIGCVAGMLPGLIFIFVKIAAKNYFQQLEQRIQAEASNIDKYLEQRVQVLQNVVGLLERAVELDKDVMKSVAALRSGQINEQNRSEVNAQVTSPSDVLHSRTTLS